MEGMSSILMLVALLAVFYFLMIRPENKRKKAAEQMRNSLKKGDKVQLVGFGSFEVRAKAARKGKNPRTGEEITIAASKAPAFKAGKAFKDYIA